MTKMIFPDSAPSVPRRRASASFPPSPATGAAQAGNQSGQGRSGEQARALSSRAIPQSGGPRNPHGDYGRRGRWAEPAVRTRLAEETEHHMEPSTGPRAYDTAGMPVGARMPFRCACGLVVRPPALFRCLHRGKLMYSTFHAADGCGLVTEFGEAP